MLAQLYRFKKVAGIALHISPDGSFVIDACILESKGSEITVEKKITGLTSIEELQKAVPAKTFIALNISGKGVLARKVSQAETIDAGNFGAVMPNAKFDDFYLQQVVNDQQSFVSIIRTTEAAKWFDVFKNAGYQPLALSLGPFAVQLIEDDLNVYGEELIFNGHVVKRSNPAVWQDYRFDAASTADFKIKIQQETIAEALLLPYAAALQLLLGEAIVPIAAQANSFDQLLTEKRGVHKLKANGAIMLGVVFCLLLVNFMIFSWLSSDNDHLSARLGTLQQQTNDTKVNLEQIKSQEAILTGLGWDNGISKSQLTEQLASQLPADVSWTSLMVNPAHINEGQQEKGLAFNNHTVVINGTSNKVLSVNEWIARLKTRAWIKEVKLASYNFSQEQNTGLFTILITY